VSRALVDAAAAAAETARATETLAEQLAGRRPVEPRASPAAARAGAGADPAGNESAAKPAAGNDAARAEPDAGPPADDAAEAIADLLGSTEVQRALAMAERARRLAAQAAREAAAQARKAQAAMGMKPGAGEEPGAEPTDEDSQEGTDGGAMAGRTEIQPGDPLRGLDAARRAAIYKLPPRVRDPLLEGMRQKGPAAYQDVIDTYFRQLGRDIPQ
jgi:hypothetical protein